MLGFDMLDDVEEILQPLCLCINQDFSRVGVGHHNGYVIYRIDRCLKSVNNSTSGTEACGKNESAPLSSSGGGKPHFTTKVEAVFPPKQKSNNSTPTKWDVSNVAPQIRTASLTQMISEKNKKLFKDDEKIEKNNEESIVTEDTQSQELENDKEGGKKLQNERKEEERIDDCSSGSHNSINKLGGEAEEKMQDERLMSVEDSVKDSACTFCLNTPTKNTTPPLFSSNMSRPELQESMFSTSLSSAKGVGVMALLYKTRFVAVVGGGPTPIGDKNVVHLFVTGNRWPERSVCVPDPVKALRLDHRLLIILTTCELRLQSLETEQCFFVMPLMNNDAQLSVMLSRTSTSLVNAYPCKSGLFRPGDKKCDARDNNSLNVMAEATTTKVNKGKDVDEMHYDVPFAIDYGKKCFVFCSSSNGFSFVRYNTESLSRNRAVVEVLATVPHAHQHPVATLALHLIGNIRNSRAGGTFSKCRWCHVATSSQQATLIRIWRYYDNSEDPQAVSGDNSTNVVASSTTQPHNYNVNSENNGFNNINNEFLGYFVMIKEVRNESIPAPIFQMQFIGKNFLFCVSQNILKVFFVGEREEPKPYDISTKDPNKAIRAQNNQSSLRHLGLVSAYFSSEWAACTCPLPLRDNFFLPKWVNATFGELRKYLLRGVTSYGQSCSELSTAGDVRQMSSSKVTNCSVDNNNNNNKNKNENKKQKASASMSLSSNVGALFRRCVSMQVTPFLENANWFAKRYWDEGKSNSNNNNSYFSYSSSSFNNSVDSYSQSKRLEVGFQQKEDSTMTDIAQSIVIWWEQPKSWQTNYITNTLSSLHTINSTTTSTTNSDIFLPQTSSFSVEHLYCVTCDGSAVMFTFNPIEGKVTCGGAVAVTPIL